MKKVPRPGGESRRMLTRQFGMTVARSILIGAALIGVAAVNSSLTGCSSQAGAEDSTAQSQTASLETLPLSPTGKEFLTATFEMGLLEIGAAQLASEKSKSVPVQRFAQLMYQSYSRANDSLSQIAWANNFELPAQPDPKGQALLEKLRGLEGDEFDKVYSHEMRRAHKRATQLFDAAAQSAPDAAVQAFAQSQLPAIRDRFRIAQSLPGAKIG